MDLVFYDEFGKPVFTTRNDTLSEGEDSSGKHWIKRVKESDTTKELDPSKDLV